MNNLFAITIAIAAIGGPSTNQAGACGMNLPTFELMGFPVSPHQVAVMGSARVEESAAPPTLMLGGHARVSSSDRGSHATLESR